MLYGRKIIRGKDGCGLKNFPIFAGGRRRAAGGEETLRDARILTSSPQS